MIRVWDAKTGKVIQTLGRESVSVRSVSISPDGKLAAAGFEDGSVDVWDVDSGQSAGQFRAKQAVTHVAVSSKKNLVLATSRDPVSFKMNTAIWDLRTNKLAYEQGGRDSAYQTTKMTHTSVIVSPDGAYFGIGDIAGGLRLWDAQEMENASALRAELANSRSRRPGQIPRNAFIPLKVNTFGPTAPIQTGVRDMALGPGNRLLAVGSRNRLHILRKGAQNGKPVYKEVATTKMESEPQRVAVSPDGKHVAVGFVGGRVAVWDSELKQLQTSSKKGLRSVTFMGFTSDSKSLLFGDDTRFIRRVSVK